MPVDGEVRRLRTEADEPGWEVDPDDDWGVAVVAPVGRQLRLRREAVGMRAAEFGAAVGYGEDLVYKIEGGKRIPRPDYLDRADEVLGAGGLLSAMKEDVKKVRYPKKVRDIARMEARAVEIGVYVGMSIHGLLQTPEHARALFEARQPPYSEEEVERLVTARMARKSVFEKSPAPPLSFCPRRGGATPSYRRDNGAAPTVGTSAGGSATAQCDVPGDAHGH
jgi:transcriptional regulator with XRE-family HTH domain